ncbi:MAG: hypothetical protein HYY06_28705 [Deltaproteobacteria bacterium]|nr:hypothetical protein [Deltaproteobacteria bacterium]
MRRPSWLLLGILAAPSVARAGGFEQPDNGTAPLGRAGAFTARASDGTAFQYNIAGLAGQRGNNLMLLSNFTDLEYCFTRAGNYPSTYGLYPDTPYSKAGPMCDNHPIWHGIGPMLGFSTDLGFRRGPVFGLGVYGPSSILRTGYSQNGEDTDHPELVQWTEPNGRTFTTWAPNRFDLVDDKLDVIYITPAVAYEVMPGLRFGAAFQWVYSRFEFTNYGALGIDDPTGPAAKNHLVVTDIFTPAFMLGAQYRLGKNFEFGLGFRWSAPFDADGDLEITAQEIKAGEDPVDGSDDYVQDIGRDTVSAELEVGQAAQLRVGARFFLPRARQVAGATDAGSAPEKPWDPMVDEVFDVEFDYMYEANSAIAFLAVSSNDRIELRDDNGDLVIASDPMGSMELPHYYKNNHSFRIGGDWNFLPGLVTGRLGVSYETSSAPVRYTLLDFAPFRRLGLHFGATVRLGPVDVSLAYAHTFQPPRTVTNGGGRIAAPQGLCDPESFDDDERAAACVTNNGDYDANFDAISIGTMWHF